MKERDEIEQLFSDTFSDEKVAVPSSVKEGIDKRISKRGIAGWQVFTIVAIVGAVAFGVWKFNESGSAKQMALADELNKGETLGKENMHSSNSKSSSGSNIDNGETNSQNAEQSASFDENQNQYSAEKNNTLNTSEKDGVHSSSTGKTSNGQVFSNNQKGNSGSLTRKNVAADDSKSSMTVDFNAGNQLKSKKQKSSDRQTLLNGVNDGTNQLNLPTNTLIGATDSPNNPTTGGDGWNAGKNEAKNSSPNFKNDDFTQRNSGGRIHLSENKKSESRLKFKKPPLFTSHLNRDLKSEMAETSPIQISNEKESNLAWELGLYSGIYNSYNKNSETADARSNWNSKIGFEASLQAKMRFKPRWAVGLGVGYGQNKLNVSEEKSSFTIDSIPDYSQVNPLDSNDTMYFPAQIDTSYNSTISEGKYSVSKISIPLYIEYRQPLFNSFYLDLALGARFNIQSWKSENSPLSPTLSKFNMDVMFRPQFTYAIRKFSAGIYGRLDYTPFGLSEWNGLRANSIRGGLGINLSYRF